MDTSKEYIKMCEKAGEIQKEWVPSAGDCILRDYHGTTKFSREQEIEIWGNDPDRWERIEILCYNPTENKDCYVATDGKSFVTSISDMIKGRHVWLLRQDQLQEMCQPMAIGEVVRRFYDWFTDWEMRSSIKEFTTYSMEQLWLCYIMKEKSGKTWNGEEWV